MTRGKTNNISKTQIRRQESRNTSVYVNITDGVCYGGVGYNVAPVMSISVVYIVNVLLNKSGTRRQE